MSWKKGVQHTQSWKSWRFPWEKQSFASKRFKSRKVVNEKQSCNDKSWKVSNEKQSLSDFVSGLRFSCFLVQQQNFACGSRTSSLSSFGLLLTPFCQVLDLLFPNNRKARTAGKSRTRSNCLLFYQRRSASSSRTSSLFDNTAKLCFRFENFHLFQLCNFGATKS